MKKEKSPAWGLIIRRGILTVLLITAGVMTWLKAQPPEETLPPIVTPQPVQIDGRTAREVAYDKDLSVLQSLMETADETTARQAAGRLEQMVAEHQTELGIEEILRQSGYPSALVLMQNGALTVLIGQDVLTEEVSAAILALCMAHTDAGAENIRIMPYAPK